MLVAPWCKWEVCLVLWLWTSHFSVNISIIYFSRFNFRYLYQNFKQCISNMSSIVCSSFNVKCRLVGALYLFRTTLFMSCFWSLSRLHARTTLLPFLSPSWYFNRIKHTVFKIWLWSQTYKGFVIVCFTVIGYWLRILWCELLHYHLPPRCEALNSLAHGRFD